MPKKKPKKSTAKGYWADELDKVDPLDKPAEPPKPLKVTLGDLLRALIEKEEKRNE